MVDQSVVSLQKRQVQEKLTSLLLEGINAEGSEEVTPEFWAGLRSSVLKAPGAESSEPFET